MKGWATRRAKIEPPNERAIALAHFDDLRDAAAEIAPVSVDPTEAGGQHSHMAWLAVSRFTFIDPVSYAELGAVFSRWYDDDILMARIGPQRLAQIRVVYADPKDQRGGGDAVISKIGAWEFIVGDFVTELLGGGEDDDESLAARYEHTLVDTFYVFFAGETVGYRNAWKPSNATTHTVRLGT